VIYFVEDRRHHCLFADLFFYLVTAYFVQKMGAFHSIEKEACQEAILV
jgi:hypothetical protein